MLKHKVISFIALILLLASLVIPAGKASGHIMGADGVLIPNCFGSCPNYAISPLPQIIYAANNVITTFPAITNNTEKTPVPRATVTTGLNPMASSAKSNLWIWIVISVIGILIIAAAITMIFHGKKR